MIKDQPTRKVVRELQSAVSPGVVRKVRQAIDQCQNDQGQNDQGKEETS